MYARVFIRQLTVNQQTPDDDRDEVYFMVAGERGDVNGLLLPFNKPRVPEPPQEFQGNDYYGLHAGESAFDSFQHRITLWEGWIEDGQFVSLATIVREQDGPSIIDLIFSLPSIAGDILTGNIAGAINDVANLAGAIVNAAANDHHDTVGAFTFTLKNQNNQQPIQWTATQGITTLQGGANEPIAQFTCIGAGANYTIRAAVQQWMRVDARHSGKTLDVPNASMNDGTQIQQYSWHGGDNQLWEIRPVPGAAPYVRIVSRRSGLCLDVANASTDDGAPVNQHSWHGGTNQQWRLDPVVGTEFYRIINRNSNKLLDIPDASVADHTLLQQFQDNGGGQNQHWRIR